MKPAAASAVALPAEDEALACAELIVVELELSELEGFGPPLEPVMPPVAPVAAIRAAASAWVVQVIEVPGELTRGRAAQVNEALQEVVTNFPFTHCAKLEPIQALIPAEQEQR